jgi:hypothetical protein
LSEISVIVPNWNGRHLLAECLTSLAQQSLGEIEILLVDNGSTDGSVEYVAERFPCVRVLALERNYGFSAACNRGIESCTSSFVALFNNDAVAHPAWAERLVGAAAESRVGIAASRVLLLGEQDRLDSAGDGMTIVGAGYKRGHLGPSDRYLSQEYVFGASGCAMLLRREMLEDIGSLDEDFFFSYEDGDLCFRAQLRGWKCLYVPDAVAYHRLNASIGRLTRDRVYYGQRNVEYLYFKNMPGWLLWKYLPAHLLNAGLALIYFFRQGQPAAFLRSKLDFLLDFSRVVRKRRQIQGRRTVSCRRIDALLDRKWLFSRMAGK